MVSKLDSSPLFVLYVQFPALKVLGCHPFHSWGVLEIATKKKHRSKVRHLLEATKGHNPNPAREKVENKTIHFKQINKKSIQILILIKKREQLPCIHGHFTLRN